MKAPAFFLLIVGCFWALLVVWMFLSIAGIADWPESILPLAFYWGGMLVGPAALIVGSLLVLRRYSPRPGAFFVAAGCVILTGFALYNSVVGMRREPLQSPPPYSFYIALIAVMLLADVAGFKVISRTAKSARKKTL